MFPVFTEVDSDCDIVGRGVIHYKTSSALSFGFDRLRVAEPGEHDYEGEY